MTNKEFAGNPTQSYRTHHALRIVGELESWTGHDPEALSGMLERLTLLREQVWISSKTKNTTACWRTRLSRSGGRLHINGANLKRMR